MQLESRGVELADRALGEAVAAAQRAAEEADLVVLPEATYPGYVLHEEEDFQDPKWWRQGIEAFAGVASQGKAYVVVGLTRSVAGRVRNTAAVLSPNGNVAGVADKCFLWHFDALWFAPGVPGEVLRLPFGDAGVFVCADARMMEIPRRLVLDGARLLCDSTALVLGPTGTNSQIEYMLAARAWENGAFLAVANKSGYEAGIAHYAGRSVIYGPDGKQVAEADAQGSSIIYAEIDLAAAGGPRGRREPESYASLGAETGPGVTNMLSSPPPAGPLRIAMVQFPTEEERLQRELVADLVIARGVIESQSVLSVSEGQFRWGVSTFDSGELLSVADARLGLLSGDRLSVPEEARRLMLEGANVLIWDRPKNDRTPIAVMRTRADENRVFLIVTSADEDWIVIAPNGTIQSRRRPEDKLEAVLVELHLALAWAKEMAPGTDVVANRQPENYMDLARSE